MNQKTENLKQFLKETAGSTKVSLHEAGLSRIWQYIEENRVFGIMSPFRANYSSEENNKRYAQLKRIIREELRLGYIELEGGYKEQGVWVKEKSLFIPNIKKDDLIKLGEKFEQYSVIYKDDDQFVEIGSSQAAGKGRVINNFLKSGWGKNMRIDSPLTKKLFSRIAKGSHRDKKFVFNMEECFLFEVDPKTHNDAYRELMGKYKKRLIQLL